MREKNSGKSICVLVVDMALLKLKSKCVNVDLPLEVRSKAKRILPLSTIANYKYTAILLLKAKGLLDLLVCLPKIRR